ncbi:hypothetical protein B296_00003408 [Ensete ventricosum]|uniref:Uncharacterized protein n=1 Tax=Ensete ventricosum TaxID=4639 RepID=A0A427B620_ENSVE|nr:hypothetical protein B296_00003408 [Ensete ventricosum]
MCTTLTSPAEEEEEEEELAGATFMISYRPGNHVTTEMAGHVSNRVHLVQNYRSRRHGCNMKTSEAEDFLGLSWAYANGIMRFLLGLLTGSNHISTVS